MKKGPINGAIVSLGQRGALAEMKATVFLLEAGYQVFRNVSAHGPIDLIGLRDGTITYFDVKTSAGSVPKISDIQVALGVKLILVDATGCAIVEPRPPTAEILCGGCGKIFRPSRSDQTFCNRKCHGRHRYAERKVSTLAWPREAPEQRRAQVASAAM